MKPAASEFREALFRIGRGGGGDGDLLPHGRHAHEDLRLDGGHEVERFVRVDQPAHPAETVTDACLTETEDVAHGQPEDIGELFFELGRHALEPVTAVAAHVSVGERDALGQTARAARVEHQGHAIEIDGVESLLERARRCA